MITLHERYKLQPDTLNWVPYLPFIYRAVLSVYRPEQSVADWWKTTFGGGTDTNEVKRLPGQVVDNLDDNYNEKTNLTDCINEERSYYVDFTNQIIYKHMIHELNPLTGVGNIAYAEGYANQMTYVDDIPYLPWLKSSPTVKEKVDPQEIKKIAFNGGSGSYDNSSGQFDNLASDTYKGAIEKIYQYDGTTKEQTQILSVENDSISDQDYSVKYIDPRKYDNQKIVLNRYTTDIVESGSSALDTNILDCYGYVAGLPCIEIKGANSGYRRFKFAEFCTFTTFTRKKVSGIWEDVPHEIIDLENAIIEILESDCLDGDGELYDIQMFYALLRPETKPCDIIEDLLYRYLGKTYDSSNYDVTQWELVKGKQYDSSVVIKEDTDIYTIIETLQNDNVFNFYYHFTNDGKRTAHINYISKPESFDIKQYDIKNKGMKATRDNIFATSANIDYYYTVFDDTYKNIRNDEYRDEAYRVNSRQYKDIKLKTSTYNINQTNNKLIVFLEDLQKVRDKLDIIVDRESYKDIQFFDTGTVDFSYMDSRGSLRVYYGQQRVQVVGISYDYKNDFKILTVRLMSFSQTVKDIYGAI